MTYFHLKFYFLLSLSCNKTTFQISTFDIFVFIEIMVLLSCHSSSQGQVKFPSFYLSRIFLGRMQFKQYFYRWKSPLIIFLLFWWHARLESCLYVFLNHGKYIITNRVGDVNGHWCGSQFWGSVLKSKPYQFNKYHNIFTKMGLSFKDKLYFIISGFLLYTCWSQQKIFIWGILFNSWFCLYLSRYLSRETNDSSCIILLFSETWSISCGTVF